MLCFLLITPQWLLQMLKLCLKSANLSRLVWIGHDADTCRGSPGPVFPLFVEPWPYNFSVSQSPQAGSGLRAFALAALSGADLLRAGTVSALQASAWTSHPHRCLPRHCYFHFFCPFTTHILYSTAIVSLIVCISHFFSCFIIWIPHCNVSFCSAVSLLV